ncbi:methyl-accepting chemotaxis protein [Shewanella baltica]|uniref:methyl-accepting chemotaxis protein n=1 Tax=Shewanella baltica TaxID=62322 RepID=UPI0028773734|nr:PAS domain-containing methyl-accepting chemotaxis protein [Shewanella baltica]MCS6174074.1 PAS domain S-box protein [Shewanella baltica]
MFNSSLRKSLEVSENKRQEAESVIDAIKQSIATVEFTPEGKVLDANTLFLKVVGYSLNEVVGQHHKLFCSATYANSPAYQQFWSNLKAGHPQEGNFARVNKNGQEIWLRATYFPVKQAGKVVKIMKTASEITQDKQQLDDQAAIFDALNRSQAIIEFTPDGTILKANANFLKTMGYSKEQLLGKHHRIFCFDEFYRQNPHFWDELKQGRYSKGLFERKNAYGDSIWLEAAYNPIMDEHGKVVKVVKFASDISKRIEQSHAVREAANIALTTSQRTVEQAEQGVKLLNATVNTSNAIAEQTHKTTRAITQLNEQSQSIQAIVATISSIADQTNLLALNAAIEAARAGEQGRGFAVVADEVRQLASRTSKSTSEIAAVVTKNTQLTTSATSMMNEVEGIAQEGKQQLAEVTLVMGEIRNGAENVSKTVSQLSID